MRMKQWTAAMALVLAAIGTAAAMQPNPVIYTCKMHGQPAFQDKPCPGMAIATPKSTEHKKTYDVAVLERKLDRLQAMGVGLIQASLPQAPPRQVASVAAQKEDFHPKLGPRLSWAELYAKTEREVQRDNAQSEHNNAVAVSRLSQDLEQMQQSCGGELLDYPYVGMSDERCWRSRRIDHRARFRLTTSPDSEPSPRARSGERGLGQSIFSYLVKSRRAPTRRYSQLRTS